MKHFIRHAVTNAMFTLVRLKADYDYVKVVQGVLYLRPSEDVLQTFSLLNKKKLCKINFVFIKNLVQIRKPLIHREGLKD